MLTSLASLALAAFPVTQACRLPHSLFEACSTWTRVATRVLADRPVAAFAVEVLQSMSLPPGTAPIATGWGDGCLAEPEPARRWRQSRRTE